MVASKSDTADALGPTAAGGLGEIIRQEIVRTGPISFARFMDLALYCPKLGYYERREKGIGRTGDFYTNISVGSLLGELLAFSTAEWFARGPAARWQIVEAGAHEGQLAADMLAWWRRQRPSLVDRIHYWIIEPSPDRQSWQQGTLANFAGQVSWAESFEALPAPVDGLIVSNELLDAFPVRRVGWSAASGSWFEWRVTLDGSRFVWTRTLAEGEAIAAQLRAAGFVLPPELLGVLPDGFTLELSLEAGRWWHRAARQLRTGRLLTFDYGLTAEELLRPERHEGTARAYARHHARRDLLAKPGEQDLTAHVNFTQLQLAGESAGLRTEGLFSQEQFLTRILQRACEADALFGEWTPARQRQFQTLAHPTQLGRGFRVLSQVRGSD